MKTTLSILTLLAALAVIAQVPPMPRVPVKPLHSPKALESAKTVRMKTVVTAAAAPTAAATMAMAFPEPPATGTPYYFINYGDNRPIVLGLTETGEMVLIVPEETPRLRIPNKTQAAFTKLESSTNLVNWMTLGYFTNFTWDFYIADVTATNKPMNFYRLVPQ